MKRLIVLSLALLALGAVAAPADAQVPTPGLFTANTVWVNPTAAQEPVPAVGTKIEVSVGPVDAYAVTVASAAPTLTTFQQINLQPNVRWCIRLTRVAAAGGVNGNPKASCTTPNKAGDIGIITITVTPQP